MINLAFVKKWAGLYPVDYDATYYDPYLLRARAGDEEALRRITEWKNPGKAGKPMPLARNKKKAPDRFLLRKNVYLGAGGGKQLQLDFCKSAPVYSIFWHHVLFDTPILDVHTNRAFQWFRHEKERKYLAGRESAIRPGKHWQLFGEYVPWFNKTLENLRLEDQNLSARDLDRALFQWGLHHRDKKPV
jgi:hypothetical protein